MSQNQMEYENLCGEINVKLERIAAMTKEEAKNTILENAEKELAYELALKIKHKEEELKLESEVKAQDIITTALERCSLDQIIDTTVSAVSFLMMK